MSGIRVKDRVRKGCLSGGGWVAGGFPFSSGSRTRRRCETTRRRRPVEALKSYAKAPHRTATEGIVAGSDGARGMFHGDVVRATVVDDKTLCGWPLWTSATFVNITFTCAPAHTKFRDVRRFRLSTTRQAVRKTTSEKI